MSFAYRNSQRDEFRQYPTTFDAVVAGLRTSTCRKKEWYKQEWIYHALLALDIGDIVEFWSGDKVGKGERVLCEITHKPVEIRGTLSDEQLERLSLVEGWTVEYLKQKGYADAKPRVCLRYKLLNS